MKIWSNLAVVVLAVSMTLGNAVATVLAGEAELALLTSYIGDWRGEGALIGGDRQESFRCRLTIAKGNAAKINYTGRCTLVNVTLSISGTIAYNDAAGHYEAAMSSNAGYTGLAVGQAGSDAISFDLRERQRDRSGSDVRIGALIQLTPGSISVSFEVEFNDSGEIMTALVPFAH